MTIQQAIQKKKREALPPPKDQLILCCNMYKQLTRKQRYAIYLGLQEKKTLTAIARQIEVSISTVSREVKRNSNRHGRYIFTHACERIIRNNCKKE